MAIFPFSSFLGAMASVTATTFYAAIYDLKEFLIQEKLNLSDSFTDTKLDHEGEEKQKM